MASRLKTIKSWRIGSIGLVLIAVTGCTQRVKPRDTSTDANGGVNIVPAAVLAAQKVAPDSQPAVDNRPDLIEVVSRSQVNHQDVLKALRMADLVPQLQTVGPFTLLAPTDEAWAKLPPGTMDRLMQPAQHDQLRALMLHHILKGRIEFKDLLDTNGQLNTTSGTKVVIRGVDNKVMINDANVVRTENAASNGVVMWVDGVLLP